MDLTGEFHSDVVKAKGGQEVFDLFVKFLRNKIFMISTVGHFPMIYDTTRRVIPVVVVVIGWQGLIARSEPAQS